MANSVNEVKIGTVRINVKIGNILNLTGYDAIVISTKTSLKSNILDKTSVDAQVRRKCGRELKIECRRKRKLMKKGGAVVTYAPNLNYKHIIHTVSPNAYIDGDNSFILSYCYYNILNVAKENNIKSIAFPIIGNNHNHISNETAIGVAVKSVKKYLIENPEMFSEISFIIKENQKEEFDLYHEYIKLLSCETLPSDSMKLNLKILSYNKNLVNDKMSKTTIKLIKKIIEKIFNTKWDMLGMDINVLETVLKEKIAWCDIIETFLKGNSSLIFKALSLSNNSKQLDKINKLFKFNLTDLRLCHHNSETFIYLEFKDINKMRFINEYIEPNEVLKYYGIDKKDIDESIFFQLISKLNSEKLIQQKYDKIISKKYNNSLLNKILIQLNTLELKIGDLEII